MSAEEKSNEVGLFVKSHEPEEENSGLESEVESSKLVMTLARVELAKESLLS